MRDHRGRQSSCATSAMTTSATSSRTRPDLNQWIPDLMPYFEGVEFKVIELDDIGHDDIDQEPCAPSRSSKALPRSRCYAWSADDTLTALALRDEGHWLHGWSERYRYRTE